MNIMIKRQIYNKTINITKIIITNPKFKLTMNKHKTKKIILTLNSIHLIIYIKYNKNQMIPLIVHN